MNRTGKDRDDRFNGSLDYTSSNVRVSNSIVNIGSTMVINGKISTGNGTITKGTNSLTSFSSQELTVYTDKLNKSDESFENRIQILTKINEICEKRISSRNRSIVNINSTQLNQLVTGCAVQIRYINLTTQTDLNQDQINSFTSQLGKLMKQIASIQKLFGVDISSKCFVDLVDSFLLYSRQDCQQMHKQLCELLNPFSRVSFDPNLILLALLKLLNDYAKIHVESLEEESVQANIQQINNLLLEVMFFFNKESMLPSHLDEILYEMYNLFETYKDTVVFEQNQKPMDSLKAFLDFILQKEGNNIWNHLELVNREIRFRNREMIPLIRYLKAHEGIDENAKPNLNNVNQQMNAERIHVEQNDFSSLNDIDNSQYYESNFQSKRFVTRKSNSNSECLVS